MPRSKKIALIIHSLAGGGAERVVSSLANHWAGQGAEVAIITLDAVDNDTYPLHPEVQRIGLDLMGESRSLPRAVLSNYRRIRHLRRTIRSFAAPITISFTDKMNIVTLIACWGISTETIICERTDPRHQVLGGFWSYLRRLVYPRCDALVVQTEDVRTWARDLVPHRRVYVIPNPAPEIPSGVPNADIPCQSKRCVMALGRLSPEKGMDLLLTAFSRVIEQHPDWQLRIHGTGSERAALEQMCQHLNLRDRVEFCGWTDDAHRALRGANLFVLPSRYEGFPNALLEAMAAGVACISFDCDSGPREIIRDEVDGILVPPADTDRLADALDRLMRDETLRRQLGRQARQVTQRFSRSRILEQWDAVTRAASEREVDELAGQDGTPSV